MSDNELVKKVNELQELLSEQKKANQKLLLEQKRLKKNISLFRNIFNAIPDVIGIQDANHTIIRYNTAGYKFIDKTHREVYNKKCYNLIGRDLPCEKCATSETYKTKKPARVERYEKELNLWLDVRAYPILDENNNIEYVIEHLMDISKQKEDERIIIEKNKSLNDVFDNAINAIYIQKEDGRFLDVNQGAVEMYGYLKEELIGKSPAFVGAKGKNDLEKLKEQIAKAFKGEPQEFIFWGKRKNGEVFPKNVRLSSGIYHGKKVIFAFAIDITESYNAKEQLKIKVNERTNELEKEKEKVEKINKFFVGREIKMKKMKKEISDLKTKIKELESIK